MNKYNEEIFLNFKPDNSTYVTALKVSERLGKLSVNMQRVFKNADQASKLFAFIESKYSSKIEGIYTTLFDVVNTGNETNQVKLIKPLVDTLLNGAEFININDIKKMEAIMNTDKDREKRWDPKFGIYKGTGKESVKIYKPSLDKEYVSSQLEYINDLSNNVDTIIGAAFFHLWFEKLHPFVDANGRIGRLLLNKKVNEFTNYSNVLPLSWSIFKNKELYYESFDFNTSDEINNGVQNLLNIILKMSDSIDKFLIDLEAYKNKRIDDVMRSSTKMSIELANDIIFNLQTKASYISKVYKLNPRTINNVFNKIESIDFNKKKIGRENLFWNIDLETLVNFHFKD